MSPPNNRKPSTLRPIPPRPTAGQFVSVIIMLFTLLAFITGLLTFITDLTLKR